MCHTRVSGIRVFSIIARFGNRLADDDAYDQAIDTDDYMEWSGERLSVESESNGYGTQHRDACECPFLSCLPPAITMGMTFFMIEVG
jgi:hypothetical protein